jgi:hypothetical protein
MYALAKFRALASPALAVLMIFLSGCTLRVEKLPTFGVNDQHFDSDEDIGGWQPDSVFLFSRNGTLSTGESTFDKGRYEVLLVARATQAYQVFPTVKVMLGRKLLREVSLDSNFNTYRIPFELEKKDVVRIRIRFDQDGLDDKGNNRDVYIRKITVQAAGY